MSAPRFERPCFERPTYDGAATVFLASHEEICERFSLLYKISFVVFRSVFIEIELDLFVDSKTSFAFDLGTDAVSSSKHTLLRDFHSRPSFIFCLSFHFSRGKNRESRSSVFLCSETARKRLLRRLNIYENMVKV